MNMVKHGKITHSKEAEINNPVTKDVLTSWRIPPFKHVSRIQQTHLSSHQEPILYDKMAPCVIFLFRPV